jgi:hypothetical protein
MSISDLAAGSVAVLAASMDYVDWDSLVSSARATYRPWLR